MASLKRKRDEPEDSEDDQPFYGKQILPVADLPDDFDRSPADGMEYLFTVRRDARSLPDVACVANPYELPSHPLSPAIDNFTPSHPALPSSEWRFIYKTRFRNFCKNFNQPTIHVEYVPKGTSQRIMPDRKERDFWWAFISGKPESEWNPPKKPRTHKSKQRSRATLAFADNEETVLLYEVPQSDVTAEEPSQALSDQLSAGVPAERAKAREPIPSLLKCIDERMAVHLLMYFVHWFNLYLDGPQARIEDRISGDDIALLRGLVRACISILKQLREQHSRLDNDEDAIRERSCWIIISTIIDNWEQHDLWMDAEVMLKGFTS
ncbi:hypothetical protein APHAL10511_001739 [Amanita phalloides]|nr:hypothetical protein APHAL10511_001739 [Amanita phalloides]